MLTAFRNEATGAWTAPPTPAADRPRRRDDGAPERADRLQPVRARLRDLDRGRQRQPLLAPRPGPRHAVVGAEADRRVPSDAYPLDLAVDDTGRVAYVLGSGGGVQHRLAGDLHLRQCARQPRPPAQPGPAPPANPPPAPPARPPAGRGRREARASSRARPRPPAGWPSSSRCRPPGRPGSLIDRSGRARRIHGLRRQVPPRRDRARQAEEGPQCRSRQARQAAQARARQLSRDDHAEGRRPDAQEDQAHASSSAGSHRRRTRSRTT